MRLSRAFISRVIVALSITGLIACMTQPVQPNEVLPTGVVPVPSTVPLVVSSHTTPTPVVPVHIPVPLGTGYLLNTLPNWDKDTVLAAWPALLKSCETIGQRTLWKTFCTAVHNTPTSETHAKAVLQDHLVAYLQNDTRAPANQSIATAYFEPLYAASIHPIGDYQWPLYGAPSPATHLPRSQLTPVDGNVHPLLQGKELAYLNNPIDAFLAQIQGSVQLQLLDGSVQRLGFAAKNGQPYQSIANTLIAQGAFNANQASMDTIKDWASLHSASEIQAVLNTNPSFVFFKWLDLPSHQGAIGALGVPLTPMRSVAVDANHIALGAPIWLETQTIHGELAQLMLAQDTGGAIKGAARIDIYAGTGEQAGQFASSQKQAAKVWVLLPKP
jgi:membrane-bound lytic murein transglycosylase A